MFAGAAIIISTMFTHMINENDDVEELSFGAFVIEFHIHGGDGDDSDDVDGGERVVC